MIKTVVFLALLGVACGQTICNKINCGTPTGDACASFDNKVWTIKACGSGKRCNMAMSNLLETNPTTKTATCETYTAPSAGAVTKKSPGFACTGANGCFSGTCTGNICQGLAAEGACIDWTASPDTDNEKELCGANLYCDGATGTTTKGKCKVGVVKGGNCENAPCALPNYCLNKVCVAPGSQDLNAACNNNLECKSGHYCSSKKCVVTPKFTTGSAGAPCSKAADCAPSPSTCDCTSYNTEGKGRCSGLGAFVSQAYVNEELKVRQGVSASKCPLNAGIGTGPCMAMYQPTMTTIPVGDCYGTARFGTSNDSAVTLPVNPPKTDNDKDGGSGSSTKIVASALGFLAYFLF